MSRFSVPSCPSRIFLTWFLALVASGAAHAATPYLICEVASPTLWPPNHTFVDIGLDVRYVDSCGCVRRLNGNQFDVAITQDEPLDDIGDGHFEPDACLEVDACGCYHLHVRAERQGPAWNKDDTGPKTTGAGDGRVYLIVVTRTVAGVQYRCCATVTVAHSQNKDAKASVAAQAQAAKAACERDGTMLEYDSEGDGPCVVAKQ
ncbi:MAG: hypothetical protein H0W72_02835 [Planctomycetes bacterium]|nr:hypothetical protein [Planctomycetota bacterium]